MATRSSSSRSRNRSSGSDQSAFRWGSTGAIAGAALGGAALAIAANLGRKFLTQAMSSSHGNWADSLAAEFMNGLSQVARVFQQLHRCQHHAAWQDGITTRRPASSERGRLSPTPEFDVE